jgi:putative oxidoreductase
MTLEKDFWRNPDLGLVFVRLSVGGLMLFHGFHKLFGGVDGIAGMLEAHGLPGFIAYGALFAEVVAALMILVGAWTRLASVIMVGNMLVAVLMAHGSLIFSVDPTTGGWAIELPMLYLLPAVGLCFSGGGKYAVTHNDIFS